MKFIEKKQQQGFFTAASDKYERNISILSGLCENNLTVKAIKDVWQAGWRDLFAAACTQRCRPSLNGQAGRGPVLERLGGPLNGKCVRFANRSDITFDKDIHTVQINLVCLF